MKRKTLRHHLRCRLRREGWDKRGNRCWITGRTDNLEGHHDGWSFSFIVAMSLQNLNLPYYKYRDQYTKEETMLISDEVVRLHKLYANKITLCREVHVLLHETYGDQVSHKQLMEFKRNYKKGVAA